VRARLAAAARIGLVAVGLLPWGLPFARAYLPLGALGVLLDAAFAGACHRLPERSLVLAGVAMPLCSRCAGIFGGMALGALVARPALSAGAWRWAITASAAPMLVDVMAQDLALHPLWHAARIGTGAIFGYALGAAAILWLARRA
jgi:uncharacterized membrane protein